MHCKCLYVCEQMEVNQSLANHGLTNDIKGLNRCALVPHSDPWLYRLWFGTESTSITEITNGGAMWMVTVVGVYHLKPTG